MADTAQKSWNLSIKETIKETGETIKETIKEILLDAIRQDPSITIKELADLTGLTVPGVRYHIDKLCKDGILSREGSTQKGKWVVKS